MKETGLVKMVLTCERCGTEKEIEQHIAIVFGNKESRLKEVKLGDYMPVPSELFSHGPYTFYVMDAEDGNSTFLCDPCYEKYTEMRRELLEDVDRRLFHFLKKEGLMGY